MTRVRPSWSVLYVLGFILYFAVNAIVIRAARLPIFEVLTFAASNTLPPALLGILVVRHYGRAHRGNLLRDVLLALSFAVASVSLTMLLTRIAFGARWGVRPDAALWAALIAGLLFVILASAASLQRERERAVQAEALRARAELAALRARIDPHFLFNTLHTLLALVHEDPSRAEEAIEQFAATLRYTFGAADGEEERTLEQEWTLVHNYLALEKLRLGERLSVSENLDPEAASAALPVLTLQPIVENAIRHAVAPRAGGGRIHIEARRIGHHLRIQIADDGPGASAQSLDTASGRGLRLVRERLDRLYGHESRVAFARSETLGGLVVTIELPFRFAT